jgi:hypothetical protein
VQTGVAALAVGPLVALSGCGRAAPEGRSAGAPSADEDPDTVLLEAVLAQVDATTALVATLRRRERGLRQPLAAVAATHDAHRTRLAAAAPQRPGTADPTGDLPRGRAAALDVVRRQEQALQQRLADAAVEAQSGSFARMLASMAAGIAQHLTTAPLADA